MVRNTDNHFGLAPMKSIGRSILKRPCSFSTTFNTGDLVPIYVDEVLPGDGCEMKLNSLVRMTTPIYPVMDNAWMDTYWFFVPRRLTWEHWEEFMGENKSDAWTQQSEYQIPQTEAPEGGWKKGSIAEKMTGVQKRNISIDSQYLRSYVAIFNEWFRNENITEPAHMSKGDETTAGSNGDSYVTDLEKGGAMAKVAKYADYFTKALPEPQKGPDVYIPLGSTAPIVGTAPVIGDKDIMPWSTVDTSMDNYKIGLRRPSGNNLNVFVQNPNPHFLGEDQSIGMKIDPSNLTVDLAEASGATINQLRQAYAIQKMYEVDARGGTRYIEILRAHFGVISPDARLQRPEYLGGKRIPINISQVIQQSSTDNTSPQGHTAAYSLTIDQHLEFDKSFVEHGILIGLACIRTEHSYQQGLDRKFSRKNRTDFYFPELANIGEQAILNKEIFAGTEDDEEVFGYQEAWAEYRYANNHITGELNSDYDTPLDAYTYADDYSELPTLSDEWIRETDVNVARTLAIQNQDQWIANFYFEQTWRRPMPVYSVPALTGWN